MPIGNYLRITIGDNHVEVNDIKSLPVSIDYSLEDSVNFQNKKSSESFDVTIPATLNNDITSNTFRNANIEDLTTNKIYKSFQKAVIEANGYEFLVGKAFLKKAIHSSVPISYSYNFLGDNADWLITLKEKTLYDFLNHISFVFDKPTIQASWSFDGTNENLPYVFAPVRYRFPMGDYILVDNNRVPQDDNVLPEYLKPSISKYFILYWAFKSIGYKISSQFLDTEYFRRQVMPWTWGNFLDSGSEKLESHKFLAKSTEDKYFEADRGADGKIDDYVDLDVSNISTDGAFHNNDDYSYSSISKEMRWEYTEPDYGKLSATFSMQIYYEVAISGNNSDMNVHVDWFINGVLKESDEIVVANSSIIGTIRPIGTQEIFFNTADHVDFIELGDVVSAKVHVRLYRDKVAINDVCHVRLNVLQFQLDYFRIPLGGNVEFTSYAGFKNRNIIDFLAGVIDEFDLSVNTDSTNKIVYIEPTHEYSLTTNPADKNDGYFKNDFVDWNGKEDLSKEWELENYSDQQREMIFKYKDDNNDGILKLIQDRNINVLAQGKYILPNRFASGQYIRTNRFFSATMHYEAQQWKDIGTGANAGITPQIVCIIPENVSNTSQSESDNTFEPKSCYYKGYVNGAGAWRFDGTVLQNYPFMFAVNYQPGGENDPVLSYSDENINGVIAVGLLKRFFWQRIAITRNGQRYLGWFRLKNVDVSNNIHREFKSYMGQKWELIQIKGFKPLTEESCTCLLYKWSPIIEEDYNNTYPTESSVSDNILVGEFDIKYSQLKCLFSDIPK